MTSLATTVARLHNAGPQLRRIPEDRWPAQTDPEAPVIEVWISTSYLVVVSLDGGHERMTVNRTSVKADGGWGDGITWDALQRLKAECGRGDRWAVEVYPPDQAVVNVANLRHLWLLTEAPAYGWHPTPARTITYGHRFMARFDGHCTGCDLPIHRGQAVQLVTIDGRGQTLHDGCTP